MTKNEIQNKKKTSETKKVINKIKNRSKQQKNQ